MKDSAHTHNKILNGNKNGYLLLSLIGLCLFYAIGLGNHYLLQPDEARYAEIAREMLISHNFITPMLNHMVFFDKPPMYYWLTAFAFKAFGITDWLDGYLARTLSVTSDLGAFLDPVADKLVVVSALILLVSEANLPFFSIAAVIIAGREIVISALREWMAELGKRSSIAVSYLGKAKTVLQFLAILFLLLGRPDAMNNHPIVGYAGYIFLCIAAFMTIWSMLLYLRAAKHVFRQDN